MENTHERYAKAALAGGVHPTVIKHLQRIRDWEAELLKDMQEMSENGGDYGIYVLDHARTLALDMLDDLECMA